jgi:tRNA1Val (adenine37-N6)-methyltransferase
MANELQNYSATTMLDIGTGTGLLSLMLAQKTNALIEAVEIDKDACVQANENITNSPWQKKIAVYHTDILQFKNNKKYDCIISNPPFFEGDLKSENEKKNFAKHDTSLNYTTLLEVINNNLTASGFFAVLLPYHRSNFFEIECNRMNYFLHNKIDVKQTASHQFFRAILIFSRIEQSRVTTEIVIKNKEGHYTVPFTELLKDYYLYL